MAFYKGRKIHDNAVSIGYADPQDIQNELEMCNSEPFDLSAIEQDNDRLSFSIFNNEKVVGEISLHDISIENKELLIGYTIFNTSNRNKGIGTKALNLVKQYAVGEMNIESLVIITGSDNYASKRIAVKCGFSYAGAAREGDHLSAYIYKTKT